MQIIDHSRRTLLVKAIEFRIFSCRLPTPLVVLAFLPYYKFKYGSICNGLDRILFEMEQELTRLEEKKREKENERS